MGTGDIAQQLTVPAVLPENWNAVPSTLIKQLATACNSSSGGDLIPSSVFLWYSYTYIHIDTQT